MFPPQWVLRSDPSGFIEWMRSPLSSRRNSRPERTTPSAANGRAVAPLKARCHRMDFPTKLVERGTSLRSGGDAGTAYLFPGMNTKGTCSYPATVPGHDAWRWRGSQPGLSGPFSLEASLPSPLRCGFTRIGAPKAARGRRCRATIRRVAYACYRRPPARAQGRTGVVVHCGNSLPDCSATM